MNSTSSFPSPANDPNGTLYKTIGVSLAIASGVFIGSSFVFKKRGLIDSMKVEGAVAGEGHGYLKNPMWWTGMNLMIVGEICNFVAYAFTQAILVTPLGALSVVISAVLSSVFLHERLNFQGKVGCTLCIIGATIIVLHAPEQKSSASSIASFENLALAPGFLTFAILDILASLFLIIFGGPRWGKKNIFVYISICSMIGGLSVVSTQGLGAAIVNAIATRNWDEFKHVSLYILLAFVVVTLLTEINYLNKALNLFNTALVTPIYYVTFTSMTIICSAILFQGFNASPQDIVTLVLGFIVICAGILLLQTSRSQDPRMLAEIEKAVLLEPNSVDEEEEKTRMLDPSIMELRANPIGSIRRFSRYERDPPPPPRPERASSGGLGQFNLGGMHFRRRSTLETTAEAGDLESRGPPMVMDSPSSVRVPNRFSAANRSATIAVGGGRDGVRMYLRDRSSGSVPKIDVSDRDSNSGGDISSTRTPTSPFSTISSHGPSNISENADGSTIAMIPRNNTVKFDPIPEKEGINQLRDPTDFLSHEPDNMPRIPPPPSPPKRQSASSYFSKMTGSVKAPHSVSASPAIVPEPTSPPPPPPKLQTAIPYFSKMSGNGKAPQSILASPAIIPEPTSSPSPQPSSPIANLGSYITSFLTPRSSASTSTSTTTVTAPPSPPTNTRTASNPSTPSQHPHHQPINPIDQLHLGITREEDGDHKRLVSSSINLNDEVVSPNAPATTESEDL